MKKIFLMLNIGFVFLTPLAIADPIQLHPANPHYFFFNGKPTILITSAEHYGAMINRAFDYTAYFDALKKYGLNYTRIYPGALLEKDGKWIVDNTLGPKPENLIVPWARSATPGYAQGGNLFDLDQWDVDYFHRLKDFLTQADARGIVVEICFFNAQYDDTWPISPLYFKNNIQGVGQCDFKDAQTLKNGDLVGREDDYVRKIVQEANPFDNVILEVCDEPFLTGTPIELAGPWIDHMVKLIKKTESDLPKKHLIAQQVEGPLGGPCDFSDHPDVPLIVTQYVWESSEQQLGGMQALDCKYACNKAIELNETFYYPVWYKGDKVAASRVEAWEFIVGGGAGFNHLNGLYTVPNPRGDTPDNRQICAALKNLMDFMNSFDYLSMRPDKRFLIGGVAPEVFCRGISQTGKQYSLYVHHSRYISKTDTSAYEVASGRYSETLTLNLPAGDYQVDWIDPATGSLLRAEKIAHSGGNRSFATPTYTVDIALRIKRV